MVWVGRDGSVDPVLHLVVSAPAQREQFRRHHAHAALVPIGPPDPSHSISGCVLDTISVSPSVPGSRCDAVWSLMPTSAIASPARSACSCSGAARSRNHQPVRSGGGARRCPRRRLPSAALSGRYGPRASRLATTATTWHCGPPAPIFWANFLGRTCGQARAARERAFRVSWGWLSFSCPGSPGTFRPRRTRQGR